MSETFEVRQLTPEELPTAIDVANRAFGFGQEDGFEFLRDIPYVWNADRADNTWACFDGGEMIGVIGAYPFEVKMAGVSFRATCVGQVGTPEAHRGRGVMSALLTAATAKMDADVDFAWLGGDRQRYGRFGWAFGGDKYWYQTNARYLPDPPDASTVRPMDPAVDGEMIWQYTQTMPYAIGFSRHEFDQLLGIHDVTGLVSDNAWVLCRGSVNNPSVLLADGPTEAVAGLLACLARDAAAAGNDAGAIAFETPPCDCALARVALKHYASMEVSQVGGLRLCDMEGYFEKACRIVEPTLAGGSDEITFTNADTGQTVRIVCTDGALRVDDTPGGRVVEATTTGLSEIIFAHLPLDAALPGLAANSPLRHLLRMPVYLPFSLYAM